MEVSPMNRRQPMDGRLLMDGGLPMHGRQPNAQLSETSPRKEKGVKRRHRSRSSSAASADRHSKSDRKRYRSSHYRSKRQSTRRLRSSSADPAPDSSNPCNDPRPPVTVAVKQRNTQDAPQSHQKGKIAGSSTKSSRNDSPVPVPEATPHNLEQHEPASHPADWPAITPEFLERFLSSLVQQEPQLNGGDEEVIDLTTAEEYADVASQNGRFLTNHSDTNVLSPIAPAQPEIKFEDNTYSVSNNISSGSTIVDVKDDTARPPFSRDASITLSAFEDTMRDMADQGEDVEFVGVKARFCVGCGWQFSSGDKFCALCGKDRRVYSNGADTTD